MAAAVPVVVLFPESEFEPSVADAEDPDPVVFVPDCDLVLVADVVFPVCSEVLAVVAADFDVAESVLLLSCLLITALRSDESGHGQACVSAEKDAMVARS